MQHRISFSEFIPILCVGIILLAILYRIKLSATAKATSPLLQDVIPEPLWSLMLSTNDCYPGCSCESDRFEMTPERIHRWLAERPNETQQVLQQITDLRNHPPDRAALSQQTNIYFERDEESLAWLELWEIPQELPSKPID